jgi:uncharacterized lipoprotein NlpE involved in copper resistance
LIVAKKKIIIDERPMNLRYKIRYTLLIIALITLFCSCASTKTPGTHPSEASLNWSGVYAGIIPAADGPGIKVQLTLNADSTFVLRYEYIDRADSVFFHEGTFTWDETGKTIILDIENIPPYYQAAENKLIQLDMSGNRITGDLADHYVLEKK